MGLARYVVDAVLLEGRGAREVAAAHGISKSWIYVLIERFRAGGYEALEPRSRRPRSCSHQTPPGTVERILQLRRELAAQGHDCGPVTIAHHLEQAGLPVPSAGTIWRILKREGLIVAQPQKRPRSSLIRFQADLPNELWQADITHWQLADGEHAEILNVIDDHSRLFICSHAYSYVKARDVVERFHRAAELHGLPATLLSDNGAVLTGTARHGKVQLQTELEQLGASSMRSPTTTTTSAHTGPFRGAHRYRPTAPAPRPDPPAASPALTSGSARTRSTRPARSASDTTAASTKSASAEPTKAARSSSSSPTARSA